MKSSTYQLKKSPAPKQAEGRKFHDRDLKAVNPRENKTADPRTPAQLLAAIKAKGDDVDSALTRLTILIATDQISGVEAV